MRYLFSKTTIFILILCMIILPSCNKNATTKQKLIKISVSIVPLADIVKQIGKHHVEVSIIVPPGANPHVFEPVPGQIAALSKSSMLVSIGLGFEFWQDKFITSASNQNLKVIQLANYAEVMQDTGISHQHHEHEHQDSCACHHHGNPHIWCSPKVVKDFIEPIKSHLISIDPENAGDYEKNAAAFAAELDTLDKKITAKVQQFPHKKFIAQHAAWIYFARDYGLEQVGVIEPAPGKEPSPAHLKQIVDLAKNSGAKVLFTEVQFSPAAAETVAKEGGIKTVTLDPLGSDDQTQYIQLMEENLRRIENAMGR